MHDHIRIFALACASTVALPAASHAYYVEVRGANGEAGVDRPITYDDMEPSSPDTVDVVYRVNDLSFPEGVPGVAEAIDAGFSTWANEPCANLSFTQGAPSDSTDRAHWIGDMGEIYVLVFFEHDPAMWVSSPNAVGSYYWAHDGTGRLVGGTVMLNAAAHIWATDGDPDRLDVQGIVTALLGRALGISSNVEDSTTFPRYAPGDMSKRELGDDDRDALAFLYPSTASGCEMPPPPEAMCPEIVLPGEPECPPAVTTNPGDGGTRPMTDGGPRSGAPDAGPGGGTGMDGGSGDGGCAVTRGAPSSAPIEALVLVSLALLWRRRRRRTFQV